MQGGCQVATGASGGGSYSLVAHRHHAALPGGTRFLRGAIAVSKETAERQLPSALENPQLVRQAGSCLLWGCWALLGLLLAPPPHTMLPSVAWDMGASPLPSLGFCRGRLWCRAGSAFANISTFPLCLGLLGPDPAAGDPLLASVAWPDPVAPLWGKCCCCRPPLPPPPRRAGAGALRSSPTLACAVPVEPRSFRSGFCPALSSLVLLMWVLNYLCMQSGKCLSFPFHTVNLNTKRRTIPKQRQLAKKAPGAQPSTMLNHVPDPHSSRGAVGKTHLCTGGLGVEGPHLSCPCQDGA